jgi:hypothetical protein
MYLLVFPIYFYEYLTLKFYQKAIKGQTHVQPAAPEEHFL